MTRNGRGMRQSYRMSMHTIARGDVSVNKIKSKPTTMVKPVPSTFCEKHATTLHAPRTTQRRIRVSALTGALL